MESSLLDIKNLNISFGNGPTTFKAVKGLNLSLKKGQILGVVGESGSGKSLSCLSIPRLINSQNCSISSDKFIFESKKHGKVDLSSLSDEEIRKIRGCEISMIFQEPMTSLNPVFRCGDQVAESLILHEGLTRPQARLKTLELFESVSLPNPDQIYRRYPHEISGGQKQRVMIAMAISCSPDLLIADEPTTALDVTVQASILTLLKNLQKERNMGIIFVTHDLAVVSAFADRILVMFKGEAVEEGTCEQIFSNPQHPYTKGLIHCRPKDNERLFPLPTLNDYLNTEKGDKEFTSEPIPPFDYSRNSTKILEVKELKKFYTKKSGFFKKKTHVTKAIDDVTFDVFQGETLGLVGESGCGKTTLGRTILGLIRADSGKVIYKTKDLFSLDQKDFRKLRKKIQIIFQDPYSSLNPRMRIGHAIQEPILVHKLAETTLEAKEKTLQLLKAVGLNSDHYNRFPHEFSGGQRQRICIARALALEPEFIICDESVSALDVSVQAQILNLLNSLKAEFGLTFIFISHDLNVVKYMSDRILIMKDGEIVERGDPEGIYKNPQTDYTRSLINAIPKIKY